MGTVLFLVGPKAAGKTWLARLLREAAGVYHVDTDVVIMDLLSQGIVPDGQSGWLRWLREAVAEALRDHSSVSVEVTGASAWDYQLADDLEAIADRVVRILMTAPEAEVMSRLAGRSGPRAPVTEDGARSIYRNSIARAANARWDLVINSSGMTRTASALDAVRPFLPSPS